MTLKAPFPWFGGKSRVANIVWPRFGKVRNYIEPFFGSGAMLLGRPAGWDGIETANDRDALVVNFWRALQAEPDALAEMVDGHGHEAELHARHLAIVNRKAALELQVMGDPEYYDLEIAAWWVWGISMWIGSGWCSGVGPWQSVNGVFGKHGDAGQGVERRLRYLGAGGRGVNRQRLHLGNAGQGVRRQLLRLGNTGRETCAPLVDYMRALSSRLKHVRFTCGDWRRVLGRSVLGATKPAAVFLDPPYGTGIRDKRIYREDTGGIARDCLEWCKGAPEGLKIALCGYEGEHNDLEGLGWGKVAWKTGGGYARAERAVVNAGLERIWFSPACEDNSGLFS